MSNFKDLLSKPLPSASSRTEESVMKESVDETAVENTEAQEQPTQEEQPVQESGDPEEDAMLNTNVDDDGDPIEDPELAAELSDLSDNELEDLEKDLNAGDLDFDDDDETEEVSLSPEEEEEADDFMSVAATNTLIQSEMNTEEKVAFAESATDVQIAINEGLMTEADAQALLSLKDELHDAELVQEAVYNGKTKVKMNIADRIKQLFWVGVYSSARAHKDPEYVKLQKVFALKRKYKSSLARKYRSEANKKVKVYVQRLRSSKSPVLNKLGDKLK